MYTITLDGNSLRLFSKGLNERKINSPKLNMEINKLGSFTFDIYPDHPYYDRITKLKSYVNIYDSKGVVFRARVFNDTVDFRKVKHVECEGLGGYLNDSIVRPYTFTGSVRNYLKMLIDQHNKQVDKRQKITLGKVTVTDPNNYITRANSNSPTTWSEIQEKLVGLLGGYIHFRYTNGLVYIDYLSDYTDIATQEIAYSVNLLDLTNTVSANDIATCIIPYGAKLSDNGDSDERVDIRSVNSGVDYIQNDEAVALYGKIYKTVIWDDVTLPANLLTKAQAYLATSVNLTNTLTIKAIDLNLSDATITSFKLGDYIRVFSRPHDLDELLLLTSYNVDLSDPSSFTFTLGSTTSSFTDTQIKSSRTAVTTVSNVNTHTMTANQTVNYLVNNYVNATPVSDLNTITAAGFYSVTDNTLNKPNVENGFLEVKNTSIGVYQIVTTYSGNTFERIKSGGVWSSWCGKFEFGAWIYEKRLDGVLKCYARISFENLAVATESGTLFSSEAAYSPTANNYPQVFIDTPTVNVGVVTNDDSLTWCAAIDSITPKAIPPTCKLLRPDSADSVSGYINIQAVGHWK